MTKAERLAAEGIGRIFVNGPIEVVRKGKTAAALTGQSFTDVVVEALRLYLALLEAERGAPIPAQEVRLKSGAPRKYGAHAMT